MKQGVDPKAVEAVRRYYAEHGMPMPMPDDITYDYVIDAVRVSVGGKPALFVGLPPVSDYEVEHI